MSVDELSVDKLSVDELSVDELSEYLGLRYGLYPLNIPLLLICICCKLLFYMAIP